MAVTYCRPAENDPSVRCSCCICGWHGRQDSCSPPWTLLWCCKMARAIWDHCPTQAIQNLSYAIFSAFSSNDISSLLNEISSFAVKLHLFSVSQRSDSLLSSKVKQKHSFLFILLSCINRTNMAIFKIWWLKFICLLMKTVFWGWLQSPEFLWKALKSTKFQSASHHTALYHQTVIFDTQCAASEGTKIKDYFLRSGRVHSHTPWTHLE